MQRIDPIERSFCQRTVIFPAAEIAPPCVIMIAMKLTSFGLAIVAGTLFASHSSYAQTFSRLDSALEKFWAAKPPNEAERMVDDIIKTGVTFDEALRRL